MRAARRSEAAAADVFAAAGGADADDSGRETDPRRLFEVLGGFSAAFFGYNAMNLWPKRDKGTCRLQQRRSKNSRNSSFNLMSFCSMVIAIIGNNSACAGLERVSMYPFYVK